MDTITPNREHKIRLAVELDVDVDDFRFESEGERELWADLADDFAGWRSKDDLVWVADAA